MKLCIKKFLTVFMGVMFFSNVALIRSTESDFNVIEVIESLKSDMLKNNEFSYRLDSILAKNEQQMLETMFDEITALAFNKIDEYSLKNICDDNLLVKKYKIFKNAEVLSWRLNIGLLGIEEYQQKCKNALNETNEIENKKIMNIFCDTLSSEEQEQFKQENKNIHAFFIELRQLFDTIIEKNSLLVSRLKDSGQIMEFRIELDYPSASFTYAIG